VVIDERLARRLVDSQFPRWADLPVRQVDVSGVDNRTFRLGDELSIRLPAGDWYSLQVAKEQRWLPVLAPRLPVPIPVPVAQGVPDLGYPYPWSVYRWLDGETSGPGTIGDLTTFAVDVAGFLVALAKVDPADGPPPGPHNFYRGGPLATYADDTLRAVEDLGDEVPRDAVLAAWDEAMAAEWHGDPVWFHGDVAVGNLLVRDGKLSAVIDFGCCGVGDPACDVVLAWTLFPRHGRAAFRRTLGVDPATWSRGLGWALWKALIVLREQLTGDPAGVPGTRTVLARILSDHARQA
jgi:aminoglycoside phosphotransferase (APT) family kinase protein